MRVAMVVVSLAVLAGCGPADVKGTSGGAADAGDIALDGDAGGLGFDAGDTTPPTDAGTPPGRTLIYAHTDTNLFQLDPSLQSDLQALGAFDCVTTSAGAMTDLAVDKDGKLFGITTTAVHPLQLQSGAVHCGAKWTLPASKARFYGLTFAPAGVLAPQEMLVAANSAGELWAIDSQGNTTQVGTFGTVPANDGHGHTYANAGKEWELSGDIVFLTNSGHPVGFATARDCPNPPSSTGCNRVDTLLEIDISKLKLGNTGSVTKSVRGEVVKSASCADASTTGGYGSMYGIGAWNDKVYGFSRDGNVVEVNLTDGSACLVKNYPGDKFAGAGVTTSAPMIWK